MAVMTTEDAGTVLATVPLCRQKEALGLGLTPGLPLAWPKSQAQVKKIEVSIRHGFPRHSKQRKLST